MIPSLHWIFEQTSSGQDVRKSYNLENLNDLFSKQDYLKILSDSELFWLAFCKFCKKEGKYINISIENNNLTVNSIKCVFGPVSKVIEGIRKGLFEDFNEKKDVNFLVSEGPLSLCIEKDKQPRIIPSLDSTMRCDKSDYVDYIEPTLQVLLKSIGATYKEEEVQIENKKLKIIKVQWDKEHHFVYSIPPLPIPERKETGTAIYSLFQKQKRCDFTLQLQGGKNIKIHSIMLDLYGGDILQNMLNGNMKESTTNMLDLSHFSEETIMTFIDFIYLGPDFAEKKLMELPENNTNNNNSNSNNSIHSDNSKELNLFELFEFAHFFQIQSLIDWCANQISLFATPENFETIHELGKRNDHLKKVAENMLLTKATGAVSKLLNKMIIKP